MSCASEKIKCLCVKVSCRLRPVQPNTIFDYFFVLPAPRITLRRLPYKLSPLPSLAPPRFNCIIWLAVTTSLAATQNLSPSLALFLPRLQRGVSMETRQRQRSVSEQKVHPGGEGGSAQILQQTGCEWNEYRSHFKGGLLSLHSFEKYTYMFVFSLINWGKIYVVFLHWDYIFLFTYEFTHFEGSLHHVSPCTCCMPETWICSVVHNLPSVISFFPSFFTKARDPKAVMKIETLNATFQPAKIGNPCGLQITYLKDNSTRNIFVYHSDAKVSTVHCLSRLLFKKSNGRIKAFPHHSGLAVASVVPELPVPLGTATSLEHCMLSVLNTLRGEICFNNSLVFRGFAIARAAMLNILGVVFFFLFVKRKGGTFAQFNSQMMSKYPEHYHNLLCF